MIDVLPYIGDHGLIDTSARDSQWKPNFVNQVKIVQAPAGVDLSKIKIYYSKDNNPSLSQLHNPLVKNDSGWSATIEDDITEIAALKFDFGDIELNVNDSITLEWPMRAPKEAPSGQVTWNSFGYGATYPDEHGPEPFLPSEPIKVGYEIKADPVGQAQIGDYIWEDLNKNGIQEEDEPGINGVLVKLLKDGVEYKYTRSGKDHYGTDGYFLFPNLPPYDYVLEFELPAGYEVTPKGLGGDNTKDSDIDISTYKTDIITLGVDESNLNIDAGIYQDATLGDYIWHDRNADGKQNSGDVALPNKTVHLYDAGLLANIDADESNDIILDTKQTDANGKYQFTTLDPGFYFIRVVNNGDYKMTNPLVGNNTKDSNLNASGQSDIVFLQSGEVNLDIDGGMYMATLGDLVWHDKNANGVQDSGEPGIKNVTVKLYKDDVLIGQKNTDGSGKYTFEDLTPGNYKVEVMKPTGYDRCSPKDIGTSVPNDNDNKDSDGTPDVLDNPSKSITDSVTLVAGERNKTLDQGLFQYATLGDKVWNDLNHNGIQETNEPGIANVEVELKDVDGNMLTPRRIVTTDGNGYYLFNHIIPGEYRVDFNQAQVTLQDYVITQKDMGDNGLDSDIDGNGQILNITLVSGDNITNMDAGFHKGLIGDYVWEDMNADGIQNDGETGINGVTVKLYNHDGDPSDDVAMQTMLTTDVGGKSGYYAFTDLDVGNYYIEFTTASLPDTYEKVNKDVGDDKKDSDYDPLTNQTATITLAKGEANNTIDAGYYRPASIGNYVWHDLNGDGQQNDAEPGVNGIVVALYGQADGYTAPIAQKTTSDILGESGFYQFDGLKPGSYKVKFDKGTYDLFTLKDHGTNSDGKVPDHIDSDADTLEGILTYGYTIETTLQSNEKDMTWDTGLIQYGSIGNYMWEDKNVDGLQDGDETGIPNGTVALYKRNGIGYDKVNEMQTDENGLYLFTELIPAEYKVEFLDITGYFNTPIKDADPSDQLDSDIDIANKQTTPTFLKSGENYNNLMRAIINQAVSVILYGMTRMLMVFRIRVNWVYRVFLSSY